MQFAIYVQRDIDVTPVRMEDIDMEEHARQAVLRGHLGILQSAKVRLFVKSL